MIEVRQAAIDDLDLIAPLFDAYRQFYKQAPDLDLARDFLRERFQHNQSIVLLSVDENGKASGFTQVFQAFLPAWPREFSF